MTTKLLPPLQPGDALGSPAYFRAAFDMLLPRVLSSSTDAGRVGPNLYATLRGDIDYVTPVNTSEMLAGNTIAVFDLKVFPNGAQKSVADLVNDLSKAKWSTYLYSLERVDESDVYGDAGTQGRAAAVGDAQRQSDAESVAHKLGIILARIGWVLLVVLVLIGAAIGWKVYRAVPA